MGASGVIDRTEFAKVMAFIAAAIQKPLATTHTLDVYYDLLGDLPLEALQIAAKRVVIEHRWATFPTVAEIREAAVSALSGQVTQMPSGEAWQIAWQTVGRMDPDIPTTVESAMASLPPLIAKAVRAFGVSAICYGREPVTVVRAQFVRIYEQLVQAEQKAALLPDSLKESIRQIGSAQAAKVISDIGKESP